MFGHLTSRTAVLAGAAIASAVGFSASAHGALMVAFNGGSPVTDNGAGDTDASVGRIITTQVVGGFGVSVVIANSNSPGAANGGVIQVSSLSIQNLSATPASLGIRVSDTGFTNPGTSGTPMTLTSSWGGTFTNAAVGNTASFQSFADPANAQPANVNPTAMLNATKSNAGLITESFDGVNSTGFVHGAGAYSLSNSISVTLASGGQANISGTTAATVTPEPLSLTALAGGAALLIRRRR